MALGSIILVGFLVLGNLWLGEAEGDGDGGDGGGVGGRLAARTRAEVVVEGVLTVPCTNVDFACFACRYVTFYAFKSLV